MSALSDRARALVASPPLAPYIQEHFERFREGYDPVARPDGYIPLCIAENGRCTEKLLAALRAYADDVPPRALGYDAMVGNATFRENLAAYLGRAFLGRTFEAEHLAVLAGAGTILEQLFFALADPGDGVLVPTPSYAGFWADLETRDALQIVPVPTHAEDDFRLTTALLDRAVDEADRPIKALLFTTPDNPMGRVYGRDHLEAILAWSERRGIHVVFDEIYALSTFGDEPFVSAATLRPTLGSHTHIVWAFSKDFGASGLRCGVLVSENEEVLQAVNQLAYWGACSGHTQHLLSRFVADDAAVDDYVAGMRADLRATHAKVTAALTEASIPHVGAGAGFFVLCDLRAHLDAPTFEAEDRLWRRLLDDAALNLTPGSACRIAEPGFFRLCYAGGDDRSLDEALSRLRRVLGEAKPD